MMLLKCLALIKKLRMLGYDVEVINYVKRLSLMQKVEWMLNAWRCGMGIVITGRCVIVLYSREEMRIRCGRLLVQITGSELELGTLDEQELSITGLIAQVGFLTEGA